jgi:hypothetical protein
LIKEGDKRYVQRRRSELAVEMGYDASIPVKIPAPDPNERHLIPFYIADDIEGSASRIRQVLLRLNIGGITSADKLTILLNGKSLEGETCLRDYGNIFGPYAAQWLDFELEKVRPRRGKNTLEISLDSRPAGLVAEVSIDEVEVFIQYGAYPSTTKWMS